MKRFVGEAVAQVGDKTYTLRLDFNALAEVEEKTGQSGLEFLDTILLSGKPRSSDLRLLCWAMLQHHHPDASMKEAGAVLSEDMEAFGRAMQAATQVEGDVGNGAAARPPAA